MPDTRFKQYRRTNLAEMRPVDEHDTKLVLASEGVSISKADLQAGSPKQGDMIARNPEDHDDKWLVASDYFDDNFEAILTEQS